MTTLLRGADLAVETMGLTRRFGDLVAVDHVDLVVPRGSTFGLLGRNGAGKTTMIKMLITLLPPSEGVARVAGYDVHRRPQQVRRRIGYVPQLVSADGSLTAWENLLVFARLYHIPRAERHRRMEQALEFMGLTDSAHRLVREFSGGMIRRLEIIQSMLHGPEVLFLDEPTIGLDPAARREIWQGLQDLCDRTGTALFITTHDMEEAETLCDRVAIMRQGRVIREGAPIQLRADVGPHATLEDAFIAAAGPAVSQEGGFGDTTRTRDLARRLG